MSRLISSLFVAGCTLASLASLQAATVNVGVIGTAGGTNNWPGGEPPTAAIDGQGQKYLNFGKFATGVLVTLNGAGSGTPTGLTLFAANDSPERDPASYEVYGSNASFVGAGPFDLGDFSLISAGAVNLPATRNLGGAAALDLANSDAITFANTSAYSSFLVVFPTVKDGVAANSMQIAEIRLLNASAANILSPNDAILGVQIDRIPEPSTGLLALIAISALGLKRRR